jgi:hypothetical protein
MTSHAPHRTIFTTLIGVAAILIGGLGSVFSAFALLMAIGKPYANSAADPLGIFLIFILPPGTLLAGIGLLLRHHWARWWMILLMAGLVVLGLKGLLSPDHANPAYAPLPGPAADAAMHFTQVVSFVCLGVGGLVLLGMFSRSVKREFGFAKTGASVMIPNTSSMNIHDENGAWRVGHKGRDMMYYEEQIGGDWQRIDIDGEMLTGRAHHVIYFADAETWTRYPEWARHRRDEIIERIKSRFREPDYEYHGDPTAAQPVMVRPPQSERGATILPMLLFLLAIAAASFWLAAKGVKNGENRLPMKHNTSGSSVSHNPPEEVEL